MRRLMLWGMLMGILNGMAQTPWPDYDPDRGLWGYRLNEDSWHIRPQFAQAGRFREGLAVVGSSKKKYVTPDGMIFSGEGPRLPGSFIWHPQWIIDESGETQWEVPQGYQVPSGAVYGSGMIPIRNAAGLYGYLNQRGEAILPFRWKRAWSFSETYAWAQIPDKQLDSLFLTLSKPLQDTLDRRLREWKQHPLYIQYRYKRPHAGMAYCLLNDRGEVEAFLPTWAAIPDTRESCHLSNGLFAAENFFTEKQGMLDKEMQVAMPFTFTHVGQMAEGKVFAIRKVDRFETVLADRSAAVIPGDSTFVGFLDLAGQPVFTLPLEFMEGECGYLPKYEAFEQGNGHLWLRPRYCNEFRRLRISANGQLVLYQSWQVE